jgi:transposase
MLLGGTASGRVATEFRVDRSVITRLWRRFRETGRVADRRRSGRPCCTTARDDRNIVHAARRNPHRSATSLNREMRNASGLRISTQTFRNRLHAAGLRARRPAVRPRLTRRHREARLEFARNHSRMGVARLRPILFTDESRFCLDFHDGRRRVWRARLPVVRDSWTNL